MPTLNRRHRRELAIVAVATGVGIVLFVWLLGIARPRLTDAQIQAQMVKNISTWSDADWYLKIDGTPGPAAVTIADRTLTVTTRLPSETKAAEAFALCLRIAAINHDPGTGVRLDIDRVVILSAAPTTFIARCFPPDT